jgi:hypothetical protein
MAGATAFLVQANLFLALGTAAKAGLTASFRLRSSLHGLFSFSLSINHRFLELYSW